MADPRPMAEADLQGAAMALARLLGVLAYHTHDSRRSPAGFPDLVLSGRRGTVFRELKTATGTVTPLQSEWGLMLRRGGESWDVWRPADLHSGRVQQELEAIR